MRIKLASPMPRHGIGVKLNIGVVRDPQINGTERFSVVTAKVLHLNSANGKLSFIATAEKTDDGDPIVYYIGTVQKSSKRGEAEALSGVVRIERNGPIWRVLGMGGCELARLDTTNDIELH